MVLEYLQRIIEYALVIWTHSGWVFIFLWIPLLVGLFSRSLTNGTFFDFDIRNKKIQWSIRLLVGIIAVVFVSFRFLILPEPQGSDVPLYAYYIQLINTASSPFDILVGVRTKQIPINLFLWALWRISFLDIEIFLMLVPVIFGVLLVFSAYFCVYSISKNESVAFLSSVLLASSFTLTKMTYGLFAQCAGYSLLYIGFGLLFRRREQISLRGRGLVQRVRVSWHIMLVFFLLSIVHIETWAVSVGIVIVYVILSGIRQRVGLSEEGIDYLFYILAFIPSLIGASILLLGTTIFSPQVLYGYSVPVIPTLDIQGLMYFSSLESIFIFFGLASIPLLLKYNKNRFVLALSIWIISIDFLIVFSGFRLIWRLFMLLPISLTGGLFLYWCCLRGQAQPLGNLQLKFWHLNKRQIQSITRYGLLVIILTGTGFVMIGLTYLPGSVYRPNDDLLHQFQWISSSYGFSNEEIAVFINSPASWEYRWALGFLGDVVFIGSAFKDTYFSFEPADQILRYLTAKYAGSILNVSMLSSAPLILVPDGGFYEWTPDFRDYLLLRESDYLADPGVYLVDSDLARSLATNESLVNDLVMDALYTSDLYDWSRTHNQVNVTVTWVPSTETTQFVIEGNTSSNLYTIFSKNIEIESPHYLLLWYQTNYTEVISLWVNHAQGSKYLQLLPMYINSTFVSFQIDDCLEIDSLEFRIRSTSELGDYLFEVEKLVIL